MDNYGNEELKKEILKTNNKQLENISKSSLLNVLISLNSSDKLLSNSDVLKMDKNKKYSEFIASTLNDIDRLLRSGDQEEILDLRNELYKKRSILDGYLIEISYLGQIVDEHGTRLLADRDDFKNYNPAAVSDLMANIKLSLEDSQENVNKYVFIISEIIKVLPMRLVKKNYYDILETTLTRNFERYSKLLIDMQIDNYKKQFDSSLRNGYGMDFDHYFMEIEKMKREDLSNMDLDELSEIVNQIMKLTQELILLRDLTLSLGIVTNLLLVLSRTEDIQVNREKYIKSWDESRDDGDKREKLDKLLREEVMNLENELASDLNNYELLTIEVSKREDFDHESLEEDLMRTRNILSYYNDISFSDRKYLDDLDMVLADEKYRKNAIDSLIDYMERAMLGMANIERKIRMRSLLSVIELPFASINEFMDYLTYSLDERILEPKIINFKINQINYFLNELRDK